MASQSEAFELLREVQIDCADVTLSKWRSKKSGLTVVHLDYDTPIVNGYVVVASEIFNDSGCPHTLEHLIFTGSESFPYKGVLAQLANRAFSDSANAWTDTDNTTYTVCTAGQQGFLQLLPVYFDHILYPRITDTAFHTEVHHINGDGADAGVVYSEMQGRQNTSGDLMFNRQRERIYPAANAYRSETAGLMEALRVLTAEQIREYHREYYVPQNLCLIVAGKLSTKDLLDTLATHVEPSIVKHCQAKGFHPDGWTRPFMETASAEKIVLHGAVEETIEFPDKDDKTPGEIVMTFIGPAPAEYLERLALDTITNYLMDTPVAPLNKEFVEIPSPLCSYIWMGQNTRSSHTSLDFYIGGVPVEHLNAMPTKVTDALKKIIKDGIDMTRMSAILKRDRLKLSDSLERSGGDYFAYYAISDFLYGGVDGEDLKKATSLNEHYITLNGWTSNQWAELMRRWFDAGSVVTSGKPSAQLAERLESEEKARVQAQKDKLGEEGLAKLAKGVEEAKKQNEIPVPPEILTSFPLPEVSSISWIPVQSVRIDHDEVVVLDSSSSVLGEHIKRDKASLPYFVQFDHGKSDFVTINAWLDTANLPNRLRPYLYVYIAALFAFPIRLPDGTLLSHDDVVKRVEEDTVSKYAMLGAESSFEQLLRIGLKVETKKYETGIALLRDFLYSAEFDKERLVVEVAKIQSWLPTVQREGSWMLYSIYQEAILSEHSSARASGITALAEFIPRLAKDLAEKPDAVIKEFLEMRDAIMKPDGLRFSVAGNILALDAPRSGWANNFRTFEKFNLKPVQWSKEILSPLGQRPAKKGLILSLSTIETSFATHATQAITRWDHPDYPALRLTCNVLDGVESYLWRNIRGTGLAYGVSLGLDPENGILCLNLYRSPNSFRAFEEAAKVVKGLVDGSIQVDDLALDAARSSIIYSQAARVSTVGHATQASFSNQVLKGVQKDYGQQLLHKIQHVTVDQVKDVLKKYILPLFEPASSIVVVVSAPSKTDEIANGLESLGFEVEKRVMEVAGEKNEN